MALLQLMEHGVYWHHYGIEVYPISLLKKSMSVFAKVLLAVREDGWRTNIGRTDTEQ